METAYTKKITFKSKEQKNGMLVVEVRNKDDMCETVIK